MEVPHTDLSEVTRMVLFPLLACARVYRAYLGSSNLVHVGTVVMLATSQTSTTWMLAVLPYTAVTVGNVAATVERESA